MGYQDSSCQKLYETTSNVLKLWRENCRLYFPDTTDYDDDDCYCYTQKRLIHSNSVNDFVIPALNNYRLCQTALLYMQVLYGNNKLNKLAGCLRNPATHKHNRWIYISSYNYYSIKEFVIRLVEMRGCHWFESRHVV